LYDTPGTSSSASSFLSPPGWSTAARSAKPSTIRRIAEAPGEGGNAAVQFLREQERIASIRTRESLKIGGIINIGVGIGHYLSLRPS